MMGFPPKICNISVSTFLLHSDKSPFYMFKAIVNIPFSKTSPFLPHSLNFCTNNALLASKRLHFKTPQKADSVIAFFKSHGFSDSHITTIVEKQPQLLTSNPKIVLPKFQVLASVGASTFDIVDIVTKHPVFAMSSLENNIIPIYETIRGFSQSDKEALSFIIRWPYVFMGDRLSQNVKSLLDARIPTSTVRHLFRTRSRALLSKDLAKAVDEVKELGFDPSQVKFNIALAAKRAVPKSLWDAKVDALKSWGWSDEAISEAFRRQPLYMLASKDKINQVMRLWVDQLGWNPLDLVKRPGIFCYSLERGIIPRALVVQYLLTRGLRNKNDNSFTPFFYSEKLFLQRFVECFIDERSQLLKIYHERKNVKVNRE